MDVKSMHFAFKLGMDRIDTQSNPDLNVAEIDWLLNEAQLIFINQLINPSKVKLRGFEGDQKTVDDLSNIVIKYPIQPPLIPILLDTGVYELDLNNLSYEYMHLVSAYVNLNLGNDCYKSTPLKFIQHDDYRESLRDPFNSPSLDFIPYNFGRSSSNGKFPSMFIYTGDLPSSYLSSVFVDYIKRPIKINFGNYKYIDGITYPSTDCELHVNTHERIVDIACQIASLAIQSPEYIQMKANKVFLND